VHTLDDRLDRARMAWLGRADEIVVAQPQPPPRGPELLGDRVHPLLRLHTVGPRVLEHVEPVLVHADDEVDGPPRQPMVARHGVRAQLLERVPQVRRAVGVVDGTRDVELAPPVHVRRPFPLDPFLSCSRARPPRRSIADPPSAARATSAFNWASGTVRRSPSSSLRTTSSRQMSTLITFSLPRRVMRVLPSRGNFLRASTYASCS